MFKVTTTINGQTKEQTFETKEDAKNAMLAEMRSWNRGTMHGCERVNGSFENLNLTESDITGRTRTHKTVGSLTLTEVA